jgi:phosphate transport system permease protein
MAATARTLARPATPKASPGSDALRRRVRWVERGAETAIMLVAITSIVSVLLILIFVGKEALPILTSAAVHREVTPLGLIVPHPGSGFVWQPVSSDPKYNILPLFAGSLKITLIALMISVPLSLLAALYVAEFAGKRTREMVKPAIELLAGIPSVVVGFFALAVMSTLVQRVFGTEHRLNALVAGIGLSFAVCPIVFSISEDALRAVPDTYRAAALALGAPRSETLLRVVVPAAAPGISAAIVLGFGRAIGETMIVVLASGNAALLDAHVGRSTRTVTATIAQELGEVVVGSPHYHVLFALGALLFVVTLLVNVVGERSIARMRARARGASR